MASFSEHLLEQRLLDAQDLTRAQEVSARTGLRLPAALARLGLVAEADIASALAAVHDLQMVSAADIPPLDPETGYSFRFLAHHRVAPIASEGDRLILAMADPEDEAAARGMAFAAGVREILPRVAT